jgi:hypothetical protein
MQVIPAKMSEYEFFKNYFKNSIVDLKINV